MLSSVVLDRKHWQLYEHLQSSQHWHSCSILAANSNKYLAVSEFGFPSIQGKLPCCMACKGELFNVFKTGMADVLVIIA